MRLLVYKNKNCKGCKIIFLPKYGMQSYCSKECKYIYGRKKLLEDKKNNPKKYIERNIKYGKTREQKFIFQGKRILKYEKYKCSVCNKTFIPKHAEQKYCSRICGIKAMKIRDYNNCHDLSKRKRKNELWNSWYRKIKGYEPIQEINCIICNEKFLRNSIDQKYCKNKDCRKKYLKIKGKYAYIRNSAKIIERRKNNLNEMIKLKLRMRVRSAVLSRGYKKLDHTMNLIGCSIEELKKHLEKQFKEGMNWNNYGRHGWVIDHIYPCCRFNLEKLEEQRLCFFYMNLQPLWEKENARKGGKVINHVFIKN